MRPLILYFVNLFILTNTLFAQDGDVERLKNIYSQHFKLHREAVFLHLNKNKFISGENIYFTGYLFNQQNIQPLKQATNLYVGIYDSKGKQLDKSMWQVSNGRTYGNINIKPEYRHGTYYLKASTNWMRNFKDQNGYIKKIEILEYEFENSQPSEKKYTLRLIPEGGQLVSNITNTLGFQIIDEKGLGVILKEGKIMDTLGNVIIQNIKSNAYGIGKFNLYLEEKQNYSCRFELNNGHILYKKLPETEKQNFAINVTGSINNRRIISARTSPDNLKNLNRKKYFLAIHRDGQIKFFTFKFDRWDKAFSVSKDNLLAGVNILSLLDQDFNLLAERIIFNHKSVKRFDLHTEVTSSDSLRDSIYLTIKIKQPVNEQIDLSVSIVPEESIGNDDYESIFGTLLLKSYLNDFAQLTSYYYKNFQRKTISELDLLLLVHGKSNFSWETFEDDIPIEKYAFHNGITLQGILKNEKLNKIKSVAIYQNQIDLLKTSEIQKGEIFSIQNAIITKGEPINFTLLGQKGKIEKPEVEVTFLPKMITDTIAISALSMNTDTLIYDQATMTDLKQLLIEKSIALDNVTVIAKPKENELKKNPKLTTGFWNAEKITEKDLIKNRNLSTYLRSLGFKVIINPDRTLMVYPKVRVPFIQPPIIYLDGFRLAEALHDFPLNSVDEVYYEHVGLMESNGGSIYIYRKNGSIVGQKPKEYFTKIIAGEGFQRSEKYRMMINPEDLNDTFKKYGSIYWEPNLSSDMSNLFHIKVPHLGLDNFKMYIEGASENGSLISEIIMIDLSYN